MLFDRAGTLDEGVYSPGLALYVLESVLEGSLSGEILS